MSKKVKSIDKMQETYIKDICDLFAKQKVVLFQLPTGFGKTRVAVSVLTKLIKRMSKSPVWISLPKQIYTGNPENWEGHESTWVNELDKTPTLKHNVDFRSHQILRKLLFTEVKETHKKIDPYPRFIVIDEVHRCSNLKKILNHKYLNKKNINVLLISATPVNPVTIGENFDKYDSDKEIKNDTIEGYRRLYIPILEYLGGKDNKALAKNISQSKKFDVFLALIKDANSIIQPIPSAESLLNDFKQRLEVNPKYTKKDYFSWELNRGFDKFIADYIEFQEENYHGKEDSNLMSVAERIALSGYKGIENKSGGFKRPNTPSAKRVLKNLKKRPELKLDYKLNILTDFLKLQFPRTMKSKVLIFCSYLDTVKWLHYILNKEFELPLKKSAVVKCDFLNSPSTIWSTENLIVDKKKENDRGKKEEKAFNCFNGLDHCACNSCDYNQVNCGFVLITSNSCSESIDLHRKCNIVIHFDLDWSPLRIIQRVGRLWRIGAYWAKNKDYLTTYPNVYHLKYPCSVDEEIYFRLKRRWKTLEKMDLGLDYLPFHIAVGNDLQNHIDTKL